MYLTRALLFRLCLIQGPQHSFYQCAPCRRRLNRQFVLHSYILLVAKLYTCLCTFPCITKSIYFDLISPDYKEGGFVFLLTHCLVAVLSTTIKAISVLFTFITSPPLCGLHIHVIIWYIMSMKVSFFLPPRKP